MKRQTNPNSLANLKRGNPEWQLKKDDPRTLAISKKGNEAAKAKATFREAIKEMILDVPEKQREVIDALYMKSSSGDVQAMRLLFEVLGEMKTQLDVQSDNKIDVNINVK